MEYTSIDGALLKEMLLTAASALEANKQTLNDLNVFPVPDGDTGTNMSLTMQSVVKELSTLTSDDLASISRAMSRGALKGARGNSGVILSQILRGFSKVFETTESVDAKALIAGLRSAQETAYKAVMKPKEGTVLTVIRTMAEKTRHESARSLTDLMDYAITVGEDILRQTPEMLPQLKKAGVVDAGGQGLIVIMHAFSAVLHGEAAKSAIAPFVFTTAQESVSRATEDEVAEMDEIVFAYCTEFFIQQLKPNVTEKTVDALRGKLAAIGDSLVVVGDPELVKVHVHTNNPGQALQYALELGELYKIKIENMVQQFRDLCEKRKQEQKEVGVVAVASGEGLNTVFKELGVDYVVTGGQTMNPSTEDLAAAVKKAPAKAVLLLPNNSNIILAAEQVQSLVEKPVFVLHTKSIPQGIAAMLAFDPEAGAQDNFDVMKGSFGEVLSGSVTYAVRDTEYDGRTIRAGNYLGLANSSIECCGEDLKQVTIDLAKEMLEKKNELLTLYVGAEATQEMAEQIAEELKDAYPDTDFEVVKGDQPVYYFLLSAE